MGSSAPSYAPPPPLAPIRPVTESVRLLLNRGRFDARLGVVTDTSTTRCWPSRPRLGYSMTSTASAMSAVCRCVLPTLLCRPYRWLAASSAAGRDRHGLTAVPPLLCICYAFVHLQRMFATPYEPAVDWEVEIDCRGGCLYLHGCELPLLGSARDPAVQASDWRYVQLV